MTDNSIEIYSSGQFQSYVDAHLETFSLKYAVPFLAENWFTGEYVSHVASQLVFSLTHAVYSLGSSETEVQFQEPATWIDAFKSYYMFRWPRFITRHWRVNYKTLMRKVTARALLPDVPVRVGEHTVRFVISGEV